MEFDILWRTPHKRLSNLSNVVKRLLLINCGAAPYYSEEPFSPRRLLFGLFVLYQNTKKEVKILKSQAGHASKHIDKLVARIKELEEYEKKFVYAGYKAEIIYYRWSCGDGCCSDSWYGYQVMNQFGVIEYELGGGSENTYYSEESCLRDIKEKYGDIPISYDDVEI